MFTLFPRGSIHAYTTGKAKSLLLKHFTTWTSVPAEFCEWCIHSKIWQRPLILYEQCWPYQSLLHQLVSTLASSISMWRWSEVWVVFFFFLSLLAAGSSPCTLSLETVTVACRESHIQRLVTENLNTLEGYLHFRVYLRTTKEKVSPWATQSVGGRQITQSLREAVFLENLIIFHKHPPFTWSMLSSVSLSVKWEY